MSEPENETYCYAASTEKDEGFASSSDAFGPVPVQPAPACAGCGEPMKLHALFHRHPERLPLKQSAALGVYFCASEAGEDWDAWWESCAIANPTARGGRLAVLFAEAPALEEEGTAIFYEKIRDVNEGDVDEDRDPPRPSGADKLGGQPCFSTAIDPQEPPVCGTCQETMFLAAQVGQSPDEGLSVGDGMTAWAYVCPDEHEAVLTAFCD